jgi:hypothetical protein
MKKTILLGIFSIFLLTAQTQIVTFTIGPTFSKMNWDYSHSSTDPNVDETYLGFYTSLGLDYLQKKGFSLSSNIGYFTNGGKEMISLSDEMGNILGDTTFTTKLNFFTLNTLAKYNFLADKKLSPYVGVGIGLNYLVSYDEDLVSLKQYDEIDELNILLWGLIGKAGVNFNLNKIRLGAEFICNYNLNDLVNYEGMPGFSNKITVNYYSVLFSVGYKLN